MLEDLHRSAFKCRHGFCLVIGVILLSKLASVVPALLLGKVVDGFYQGAGSGHVETYLLGFMLVGLVNVVLMPIQGYALTHFIQTSLRDASVTWVDALFLKKFELFDSLNIGKLLKSVERGIHASERMLNYLLATLLPLLIEFIVIALWLAYVASFYFLGAVILLSVVYLLLTRLIIKWRRAHIDEVNDSEDEQAGVLANTLQAGKQIRLERARSAGLFALHRTFDRYRAAATKVGFSASLLGASKALFLTLATAAVIAYGILVNQGETRFTAGEFVAIFTLSTMFFNSVFNVGEAYRFADQFASDHQQFRSLLDGPAFNASATCLSIVPGNLVYPASTARLAAGLSLDVTHYLVFEHGQTVALIGPSGSGKTSLLEFLAGVRTQAGVQVRMGDVALSAIAEDELFRCIRYCPQMPRFLAGSLAASVFFGATPPGDLQAYTMAMDISRLFEPGTARSINEDATNIAGGEAKRLSLLRILMRPGFFNLFDEPTSSVDPRGASAIWSLLFEQFAGQSLICVTHDFQELERFDRVIVLDQGRVVADGRWSELESLDEVAEIVRRVAAQEA